jgi:hypothetical protein
VSERAINRRFDGHAWEYLDDDENNAALLWLFDYRFNLADFDDWIEDERTSERGRANLLGLRAKAMEAFRAGAAELVEARVQHMRLLLKRQQEDQVLIPHVEADLRYRSAQADRARGSGKLTEAAKERIRSQYARRVRDGQKYGAIKAIARALDVSEKTISAIVRPKTLRK